MGHLFVLTLTSALALALLYMAYKWLLADECRPAFNRALLLCFYVVAPLVGVALLRHPTVSGGALVGNMTLTGTGTPESAATVSWSAIVICVWFAGVVVALVRLLIDYASILRLDNRSSFIERQGRTIMLLDDDVAPFSFGGRIYMSKSDADAQPEMIIAHEEAHVRLRHSTDILIASLFAAVQWFNPAAWLMIDELKSVHEYQADRAVLDSGIDARAYQLLLIKKAVGGSFPAIANSLNHSKLKKRITMMQKSESGRWRAVRALAVLPALAAAALVVNIPAVASTLDGLSAATLATTAVTADKVSEKSAEKSHVATADLPVEKVAQFKGGEMEMMEWLVENIRYPQGVTIHDKKRCVVRFTVSATGKIESPEIIRSTNIAALDNEALRVIKAMPDFEPATSGGKPVSSTYVLPVVFAQN